jgi:hypothetical protein
MVYEGFCTSEEYLQIWGCLQAPAGTLDYMSGGIEGICILTRGRYLLQGYVWAVLGGQQGHACGATEQAGAALLLINRNGCHSFN